jgi:hypothetical protein
MHIANNNGIKSVNITGPIHRPKNWKHEKKGKAGHIIEISFIKNEIDL